MDASLHSQNAVSLLRRSVYRLATGRTARVFAIRSLGAAALFGLEISLARWLGVSGYGTFSIALAIAGAASRLAPLGWLNNSTRFVSGYIKLTQLGLLKGSLVIAYVATSLGLMLSVALLALAGSDWGSGRDIFFRYAAPVAVALGILELHRHILRGLHAGELGEALVVLVLPALVTALVWGLGIQEASVAAHAYAAVCLGLALGSAIVIVRRLPAQMWRTRTEIRWREWSLAAFAIFMGSASTELITRTSVFVLGALGADHDAGLYNAAARLAIMNVFVLRCLTPVAAPRFSELYVSGQFTELRILFRQLCVVSFLGSMPCFLVLAFFPQTVLGWFGSAFVEGEAALRVLSIGYLASAATGPCATALMMIGRERAYASLTFAALLASAAANYMLVQRMGAVGAAVATAGIMVLNNALYIAVFLRATAPSRAGARS